jgi:hypothetical protein
MDELVDNDGNPITGEGDNSTIRQMRAEIKAAREEAAATAAETAELREFKANADRVAQESAVKAKFTEAGLPEGLVRLYMKEEQPPENVVEWAAQFNVAPASSETRAFGSHTPPAGVQVVGTQKLSVMELEGLWRSDPAAAIQAIDGDRVSYPNLDAQRRAEANRARR